MESAQPEIFVLGGPNGAGKTTVAGRMLPHELRVRHFVNADLIAQALSPFDPDAAAMAAGRDMLRRLRELRAARETFAFESTLASRTFAFLRDAREAGYAVHVIYVSLRSADLAVNRVRLRVERGGHHVPEDVVRRRYDRGLTNLFQLYLPLAAIWVVLDNSEGRLSEVAHGQAGLEPVVLDVERWESLRATRDTAMDDRVEEKPSGPAREHLDRRLEQIQRGASEAIRREVAWLRRHNFPVWVDEDGRVVDATQRDEPRPVNGGGA